VRRSAALLGLLVTLAAAPPAAPFFTGGRGPLLVRFAGTFAPWDAQDVGKLNALTVQAGERRWRFEVDELHTIAGPDPGNMLLTDIVPPVLYVSGAAQQLGVLADPGIVGKPLTLEGWLYLADRRFFVSSARIGAPPGG